MGNNLSVQEKIYKCAKGNEATQLQDIFRQLVSAAADIKKFIEFQDPAGYTPLTIACNRGNYACVEMLLRHGANLHHFTRLPEGSTALHEAVNRSNLRIVEILLQYGANPFMENGRGLTCVDVAINRGHVAMVRTLELRSDYTGTLQIKVSKYLGLGAEWKSRWIVIMPRYQIPNPHSPTEQRVARSLLVCYKSRDQCDPSCKVWLDGAVARSVTGSRGSGYLQCSLSLHRNHAMASGAIMTGDATTGYTMHLRPPDGSSQGSQALRRFMEIVNGSRALAAPEPQQQPGPSRSSSQRHTTHHHPTASDEELARQLQEQYDAEMGGGTSKQPPSPIRGRNGSQAALYPHVGAPSTSSPTASSQQLASPPSAPLYPDIDQAAYSMALPSMQGVHGPLSGGPSWVRNAVPAQAPPQFLPQGQPSNTAANGQASGFSATTPSPLHSGSNTPLGQNFDDDEAGQCVICMAAPATAGFLHGESVHKCCCKDCAMDFKEARTPTCPMCRMPIEHVILNFY